MANRELVSCIAENESVRPAVHSSQALGEEIDVRDCDSVSFLVSIGAIVGAAGDGSIEIQESDTSGSGFAAVADADLTGAEPTALTANSTARIGYIGSKRYVRAVLNIGGETSIAGSVMCVKGHLNKKPEGVSYAS